MKLSYRRMNVLLVDPISTALDTLDAALEPFHFYRVWRVRSVDEANRLLAGKRLHLVICAAKQQPISGFQLLAMMGSDERLKGLPVILTVDRRDQETVGQAKSVEPAGVVLLPLEASDLRQAVEAALAPYVDEKEETYLEQIGSARQAMRRGDLDAAEKAYRLAISVKAEEEAQLSLGKLLKDKGDFAGAEEVFLATLKAHPSSLRAFLGLAEVYQAVGRLEEALKVLAGAVGAAKKLTAAGQARSSIYFFMGELELELMRLQEAMGLFGEACRADPANPRLPAKIGDALSKAGYVDEAVEFYQKALALDPELAHVYNHLGMAYRRQGNYELALNLYQKALTFHPEDENLLYNMARCYWEMGDFQCAAEQLSLSLKLKPAFPEAVKLLDAVLKRLGYANAGEAGKDTA